MGGGFPFSHAVAFKNDTMSVVNDPVEDGVSDCGLANHVVPLRSLPRSVNTGSNFTSWFFDERQYPIVQQIGRRDGRLAVIQ